MLGEPCSQVLRHGRYGGVGVGLENMGSHREGLRIAADTRTPHGIQWRLLAVHGAAQELPTEPPAQAVACTVQLRASAATCLGSTCRGPPLWGCRGRRRRASRGPLQEPDALYRALKVRRQRGVATPRSEPNPYGLGGKDFKLLSRAAKEEAPTGHDAATRHSPGATVSPQVPL